MDDHFNQIGPLVTRPLDPAEYRFVVFTNRPYRTLPYILLLTKLGQISKIYLSITNERVRPDDILIPQLKLQFVSRINTIVINDLVVPDNAPVPVGTLVIAEPVRVSVLLGHGVLLVQLLLGGIRVDLGVHTPARVARLDVLRVPDHHADFEPARRDGRDVDQREVLQHVCVGQDDHFFFFASRFGHEGSLRGFTVLRVLGVGLGLS